MNEPGREMFSSYTHARVLSLDPDLGGSDLDEKSSDAGGGERSDARADPARCCARGEKNEK